MAFRRRSLSSYSQRKAHQRLLWGFTLHDVTEYMGFSKLHNLPGSIFCWAQHSCYTEIPRLFVYSTEVFGRFCIPCIEITTEWHQISACSNLLLRERHEPRLCWCWERIFAEPDDILPFFTLVILSFWLKFRSRSHIRPRISRFWRIIKFWETEISFE